LAQEAGSTVCKQTLSLSASPRMNCLVLIRQAARFPLWIRRATVARLGRDESRCEVRPAATDRAPRRAPVGPEWPARRLIRGQFRRFVRESDKT
jgi:hypothetical protein